MKLESVNDMAGYKQQHITWLYRADSYYYINNPKGNEKESAG